MADPPEPESVQAGAAELGVILESAQAQSLADFARLLLRWNRAFNLVSRQDTDRLLPRHLLDSLSLVPWIGATVLDLGTGAGLPGLPLAIAREDAQFTLIDLSERKIRFVRQAVRELGLRNVEPRCADARALDPAARFDTVVSRAVADPAEVWRLGAGHLNAGGRLVIMSRAGGRPASGTPGQPPACPPGADVEDWRQVRIPGLQQPHEILVLRRPTAAGSSPCPG